MHVLPWGHHSTIERFITIGINEVDMIDYHGTTQEDLDKAMSMLGDLLSILGWTVQKPADDSQDGMVIGTPEFIRSWDEMLKKRKEDLQ